MSSLVGTQFTNLNRRALTARFCGKVLNFDCLEKPAFEEHAGHVSSTTSAAVKTSKHSFSVIVSNDGFEVLAASPATSRTGTGMEILSCSSLLYRTFLQFRHWRRCSITNLNDLIGSCEGSGCERFMSLNKCKRSSKASCCRIVENSSCPRPIKCLNMAGERPFWCGTSG